MAARFLKRRGYRILDRNFHAGRNEIDLIVRQEDTIVFVEVRSAASDDPVRPEDTVDAVKQQHVAAAARGYLARHGDPNTYYRFDVIAVVFPAKGKPVVRHYPNAFDAP